MVTTATILKDFVNANAAAKRLKCSPAWVRILRSDGNLPGAVRLGEWYFPVSAVEEYARNPRKKTGRPKKAEKSSRRKSNGGK